jgi:thioredoxin
MKYVQDLSEVDQFQAVITDPEMPALVDFWADWCGPCKAMAPVLERLARAYDGRLVVAKLNVDEFPDLRNRHGVQSIPTLMLFKHGKPAMRLSGFQSEAALRPYLERHALSEPLPEPAAEPSPDERPEAGRGLLAGLKRMFGG